MGKMIISLGGIVEAVDQIDQFMVSSQSQGTTADFPDSLEICSPTLVDSKLANESLVQDFQEQLAEIDGELAKFDNFEGWSEEKLTSTNSIAQTSLVGSWVVGSA